eukprot:m.193654 g.193654  ORF g.193654 m.193654 type:complete len:82 (-) comp14881_c0_seq14:191-436(-)
MVPCLNSSVKFTEASHSFTSTVSKGIKVFLLVESAAITSPTAQSAAHNPTHTRPDCFIACNPSCLAKQTHNEQQQQQSQQR